VLQKQPVQLLLLLLFAAIELLCLRQWSGASPWSRLDLYSGGYLLLSFYLAVQHSVFAATFTQSPEIRSVFYSLRIDPAFTRWSAILGVSEIAVMLDYGHWRLVPALDSPALKSAGLVLLLITVVWLQYVDRYLFRSFAPAFERGDILTTGPYRLVRHPRYSGLLFTRVSFALMLASPIAWCLCALWIVLIRRRAGKEEAHLREKFGARYEAYEVRTPRLIPGRVHFTRVRRVSE
jgi:protein-S-isoprenylcysteine O-methyltransferase Ste14